MNLLTKNFGEIEITQDRVFSFPDGLPGFANNKRFVILDNDDVTYPFKWLQSVEDSNLSFVIIDPFYILPDYEVEIPDEEVEKLKIENIADATIFAIVLVPEDLSLISANLLAPIVLNNKSKLGKQITMNTDKYKIRQYIINELRSKGGQL